MSDPWVCPNTPRCPHPGVVHDIEDLEDQQPMRCVIGCFCGHPDPEASRLLDMAFATQRVEQAIARSLTWRQVFGRINPH